MLARAAVRPLPGGRRPGGAPPRLGLGAGVGGARAHFGGGREGGRALCPQRDGWAAGSRRSPVMNEGAGANVGGDGGAPEGGDGPASPPPVPPRSALRAQAPASSSPLGASDGGGPPLGQVVGSKLQQEGAAAPGLGPQGLALPALGEARWGWVEGLRLAPACPPRAPQPGSGNHQSSLEGLAGRSPPTTARGLLPRAAVSRTGLKPCCLARGRGRQAAPGPRTTGPEHLGQPVPLPLRTATELHSEHSSLKPTASTARPLCIPEARHLQTAPAPACAPGHHLQPRSETAQGSVHPQGTLRQRQPAPLSQPWEARGTWPGGLGAMVSGGAHPQARAGWGRDTPSSLIFFALLGLKVSKPDMVSYMK